MKKIFLFLLTIFIFCSNCKAEVYYTNSNGVEMTYSEYNYINDLFDNSYSNFISRDEYDILKSNNLFGQNIEKKTLNNVYNLNSESHKTISKSITISKSCNGNCIVTLNVEWLKTSSIKSWDVIGMRSKNANIINVFHASVFDANNSLTSYSNPQIFNNGFGYSVKLPSTRARIMTSALVMNNGTIFGSYQHAKSNVSEAQSKNYSIGSGGLGDVFIFNNGISSKYDNTKGVSITI